MNTHSQLDRIDRFLAARSAWVDAGRPACMAWEHWAGVHRQSARSNPDHETSVRIG